MSAAPTTVMPTVGPTTPIPSAQPSITGWVATVSASTTTTESIEQSTIDSYTSDIADYYGVDVNDVEVTTSYAATGTMTITVPETATEEELVDAITTSIADSLGVHPGDIDVSVDMETGAVEFTVTSDEYEDAAATQFDLENDQTQSAIVNAIETAVPDVTVDSYDVSDDVTASIEFVIDANDASNDLTQAGWQSEQLLSDFDNVNVDGKFSFCCYDAYQKFPA